ncbi:MAG: hypothetical protein ABI955_03390 [Nitrospirota bacterium]
MNVVLGAWLLVVPIALGYAPLHHIGVRSSLLGATILALSLIKGPSGEQMGAGWSRV